MVEVLHTVIMLGIVNDMSWSDTHNLQIQSLTIQISVRCSRLSSENFLKVPAFMKLSKPFFLLLYWAVKYQIIHIFISNLCFLLSGMGADSTGILIISSMFSEWPDTAVFDENSVSTNLRRDFLLNPSRTYIQQGYNLYRIYQRKFLITLQIVANFCRNSPDSWKIFLVSRVIPTIITRTFQHNFSFFRGDEHIKVFIVSGVNNPWDGIVPFPQQLVTPSTVPSSRKRRTQL